MAAGPLLMMEACGWSHHSSTQEVETGDMLQAITPKLAP